MVNHVENIGLPGECGQSFWGQSLRQEEGSRGPDRGSGVLDTRSGGQEVRTQDPEDRRSDGQDV